MAHSMVLNPYLVITRERDGLNQIIMQMVGNWDSKLTVDYKSGALFVLQHVHVADMAHPRLEELDHINKVVFSLDCEASLGLCALARTHVTMGTGVMSLRTCRGSTSCRTLVGTAEVPGSVFSPSPPGAVETRLF